MFVFIVLVHIFLFIYLIYTYKISKKLQKLPKGPRGLPLLGNNLQLIKKPAEQLSKWAHQYGKLYTIRIGNDMPALVVSDAALMKQIFGHVSSTGKLQSELFDAPFPRKSGLLQAEGKIWSEQRAFFVKVLKQFGLGKGQHIESLILSEVDNLCEHLQREMEANGKLQLSEILKEATGTTLWGIISGESSKTNIAELVENLEINGEKAASYGLAFFPWIKDVAPKLTGFEEYVKFSNEIDNMLKKCFAEHKNVRQMGTPYHQDVIHKYLDHVENMKDENSSFFGNNGHFQTFYTIKTLLLAGITTVASNLQWLLFYVTAHPEVQEKVFEEIMQVIGPSRSPSLRDRSSMPYTEAVIDETLRKASLFPMGLIHQLLDDVTISGYNLPKGLILIPNIYHVHHDPEVWGDPEQFRPERFLQSKSLEANESNIKNLKDYVVAFQPGRRTCPGEFIGRDTLFLFLTGVIKTFCLSPVPGIDRHEYLVPEVSYALRPRNLNVVLTRRASTF